MANDGDFGGGAVVESRPEGKRQPFRVGQFFREVRSELRQVAWPNRAEVINYTAVTLATLLLLIGLIFVLNYAFAKGIFWLFKT
ncbi:MAG TPA: preprotein translocase subunit SecE [Acidimicrobiales bacterium]|jgi:preprotein translocase SecE subunit